MECNLTPHNKYKLHPHICPCTPTSFHFPTEGYHGHKGARGEKGDRGYQTAPKPPFQVWWWCVHACVLVFVSRYVLVYVSVCVFVLSVINDGYCPLSVVQHSYHFLQDVLTSSQTTTASLCTQHASLDIPIILAHQLLYLRHIYT